MFITASGRGQIDMDTANKRSVLLHIAVATEAVDGNMTSNKGVDRWIDVARYFILRL